MLNYSIESCSIYLWIKFKYLSHIDTQRLSECTWNASDFVLEYCTDWFPPSTASVCACPYLWNVMPSRINYWGHVTDSRSERSQLTREVQPVLASATVLTCLSLYFSIYLYIFLSRVLSLVYDKSGNHMEMCNHYFVFFDSSV